MRALYPRSCLRQIPFRSTYSLTNTRRRISLPSTISHRQRLGVALLGVREKAKPCRAAYLFRLGLFLCRRGPYGIGQKTYLARVLQPDPRAFDVAPCFDGGSGRAWAACGLLDAR